MFLFTQGILRLSGEVRLSRAMGQPSTQAISLKLSRSTVEGSLIGDSKCCMHNGVSRFVRGVGILTEAYEKRL